MGRVTTRTPAVRIDLSDPAAPVVVSRPDTVTVEEPLEIRIGGTSFAVTMRTPGDDFDLALGFLLTEGLIGAAADVAGLMHCLDEDADGSPTYNVVDVTLAAGVTPPPPGSARELYTTSSCGICGKASIDAVRTQTRYAVGEDPVGPHPGGAGGDARHAARAPEGLRPHRRAARGRAVHRRRRAAGACARTSAGTTPSTR